MAKGGALPPLALLHYTAKRHSTPNARHPKGSFGDATFRFRRREREIRAGLLLIYLPAAKVVPPQFLFLRCPDQGVKSTKSS